MCIQSGWTLVFAATWSGNVKLLEWLLQKYDFAPDKWDKVCPIHCVYVRIFLYRPYIEPPEVW